MIFSKLLTIASVASLVGICAMPASACDNCMKDYKFGQPVAVGNGMAWAWVRYDKDTKKPAAAGVTITETALLGLPIDVPAGMIFMEEVLQFPKGVKDLPFGHATLNWNPKGHIPPGIYTVPHFDFHFYTLDLKVQQNITAKDADLTRCEKVPAPKFVLPGYILPPGTIEPKMGAHWVHPAMPELNGKPFQTTFLYGSYNGRTAFWEPMIATSFLETKQTAEFDIAQPAAFDKTGYYPTKYKVSYNADRKEYSVSLEGLVHRKASR